VPPQRDQAAQLDDRFGVVVYAKVTDAVDAFWRSLRCAELLDDQRGRLLAAAVAAGRLTRFERGDHPLGQRREDIEEGTPHSRQHVSVRQHVSLHRESVSNEMPRPLAAVTPRERSRSPVGADCS